MEDALADPDAVAYTQTVSTPGEWKEIEAVAAAESGPEPRKRESMYVRMFNGEVTSVLA